MEPCGARWSLVELAKHGSSTNFQQRAESKRVTYKSPLLLAEEQSLSLTAKSPKLISPARIRRSNCRIILFASERERVISAYGNQLWFLNPFFS
jgi:hypothetical protein